MRAKKKDQPKPITLHLFSTGDASVGINSYHNDLTFTLAYPDEELEKTIAETCKEYLDIHPSVVRCTGPKACHVCNPPCDECGGRNGKHKDLCPLSVDEKLVRKACLAFRKQIGNQDAKERAAFQVIVAAAGRKGAR